MDPRTQLTGSPIERRQAWTAFRAAASRQNGPPVQYPRQRQRSQLQQRSSWRWFLHRRWTNRSTSEMVPEVPKLPNLGSNKPDTPRGKFPNASARRSNCFPFRPNGVTIRSQGTKAPVKTLEARDRGSPLTTRRMSRIAKGSFCPLFSKTSARADNQKRRSPIPFGIASCARNRKSCGKRWVPMLALSYPKEASHAQPH
jgi:hypothetical protein